MKQAVVIASLGTLVTVSMCRDDKTVDVKALRAKGPAGLAEILALDPTNRDAIDQVAGQRYGYITQRYWYTDLEQAKLAAADGKKRILSLRLLGDLRDEQSCANSRFFRTILYVDPRVRAALDDFVLHWSSERDVPVMTIDFGDGRVLKKTVTGNSAHYVLDEKGRVLDAIPGLWGPEQFVERLGAVASTSEPSGRKIPNGPARIDAKIAMPLAISKARIEAPLIGMAPISERAGAPIRVSDETKKLMRSENPNIDDVRFAAMVAQLEKSLGEDTRQNRVLHDRIQTQLARTPRPDFEEFNRWVYAEVFKTPRADPWMGLHDPTLYTALENAGVGAYPGSR